MLGHHIGQHRIERFGVHPVACSQVSDDRLESPLSLQHFGFILKVAIDDEGAEEKKE